MDTAMMVPLFSQLLVIPLMFLSEKTDIATAETPGVEYGKAYGTFIIQTGDSRRRIIHGGVIFLLVQDKAVTDPKLCP